MNEDKSNGLTQGLLQLNEIMSQVVEAAAGYRTQLETAGFSPVAAEEMAIEYHSQLIQLVTMPREGKK